MTLLCDISESGGPANSQSLALAGDTANSSFSSESDLAQPQRQMAQYPSQTPPQHSGTQSPLDSFSHMVSFMVGPDIVDTYQAHSVLFASRAGIHAFRAQKDSPRKKKVQPVMFPV